MNISFSMVCICAIVLMVIGFLFARPILVLFGASKDALIYAYPYLMLYLIGTLPSYDCNRYEPVYQCTGIFNHRHAFSYHRGSNEPLCLTRCLFLCSDLAYAVPQLQRSFLRHFLLHLSFFFLTKKAELKVRLLKKEELASCTAYAKNIVSLGTAGFIMQLTNSLVTIVCNNVLSVTGGDIYISVMTIVSSVRQLVETPIYAINEGTSPIPELQLWCKTPMPCKKSRCHDGTYDSRIHSCDVEYYHHRAENPDRNFQFGYYVDERCSSCPEAVFCGVYLHGYAIHWPNGL